jgi:hypothetical protein
MGSMNWTRGAAANSEDLNLVSSSEVAAAYAAHWRERLAVSVRLGRRRRQDASGRISRALAIRERHSRRGLAAWSVPIDRMLSDVNEGRL